MIVAAVHNIQKYKKIVNTFFVFVAVFCNISQNCEKDVVCGKNRYYRCNVCRS